MIEWMETYKAILIIGLLLTGGLAQSDSAAIDPDAIEEYSDSVIVPAMQASGVPGAILSVVSRDGVVLVKGYGVADIRTQTPVDTRTTLFNTASIGKVFTALLALQFEERGLVNLDEDVNNYLTRTQITGDPITLRQLLGHQAGFDPELSFLFVDLGEDDTMSEGELSRRLNLSRKPGGPARYDNTAYGVAGMVLSDLTNEPYAQLVRSEIFEPLGMEGAEYIVSTTDPEHLAGCYVPAGPNRIGECEYYPVYRESLRGAGGVAVSAESIASFMIALLNRGKQESVTLLSPEAFDKFVDFDNVRFHPGLLGFSRPFTQLNASNKPEYSHGGSVPGFSSILRIFDDAGIGIFFSYMGGQSPSFNATPSRLLPHLLNNQPESPAAAQGLLALQLFIDNLAEKFVPETTATDLPSDAPKADQSIDAKSTRQYAGSYVTPLTSESLSLRIMRHASAFDVAAIDDASFLLNGSGPFFRIAPDLYENDQGLRIAFSEWNGETYMAIKTSVGTMVRVPWYHSASWSIPVFLLSVVVLLTGAIYLLPRFTRKRRQIALAIVAGTMLTLILLLIELEYAVWFLVVQGEQFLPVAWRLLLHGVLLLLLAIPISFVVNRQDLGIHRIAGKIHTVALSLAAVAVVFTAWLWGIVGTIA